MPLEALGQPVPQRKGPQDCTIARPFFSAFVFVFVLASLLFSIFIDPRRASHTLG